LVLHLIVTADGDWCEGVRVGGIGRRLGLHGGIAFRRWASTRSRATAGEQRFDEEDRNVQDVDAFGGRRDDGGQWRP
jgi:hypothetical protein